MSEPLVILSLTDRWTPGNLEERIFESALKSRPFKILSYPLKGSDPISQVPNELASQAHGVFIVRHWFRQSDIAHFPQLKVVVRTGVGYERIDRKALAAVGIKVSNIPDYGTTEVADHALALALSFRRGIFLQHDYQRSSGAEWIVKTSPDITLPEQPLTGSLIQRPKGRVWGVIGLGRIGICAALRAKAFGFDIVFYDPLLPNGIDRSLGFSRVRSAEEIFAQSDVISLHCPVTPDTHHIVNAKTLSLVKPGAILINVARGELVHLSALEWALRSGKLAAAGFDIIEWEPIPDPAPPLIQAYRDREAWLEGRFVLTPHVAFFSPEAVADMRVLSAETMRDVLFDGLETNVLDPDGW